MLHSNHNQQVKQLHSRINTLIHQVGDLRAVSEEKKEKIIKLTREHYPDIVKSLLEVRDEISDILMLEISTEERNYMEDFYEVLGWIFPDDHLPVKKPEKKENSVSQNLSLYPNMQAHIQHKLK